MTRVRVDKAEPVIQAILFDVDGVIVHPGRFRSWLEREHGITSAMTAPFFKGPFVECAKGRGDLVDMLRPFLQSWGWTGTATTFVDTWLSVENAPNHEALGVVAAIRTAGISCFIASTQEPRRARYLAWDMGFDQLFDGLFFSSAIGFEKPKEGFFKEVARRLGRSGAELLFFDDLRANVDGARAAGWSAELFTSVDALRSDVSRHTGLALRAR